MDSRRTWRRLKAFAPGAISGARNVAAKRGTTGGEEAASPEERAATTAVPGEEPAAMPPPGPDAENGIMCAKRAAPLGNVHTSM